MTLRTRYFLLILPLACTGCALFGEPEPEARLLRCIYAVPGGAQTIDCDVPIARLSPAPPGGAPAARTYEVAATAPGSPTVVIVEPESTTASPSLAPLRELALGVLRGSMSPPRRALDWHFEALAGFLGAEPPLLTPAETAGILERWSAAPDHVPLAARMFENARRFDAAQVAGLAGHERVAPRLLSIVRQGLEGRRDALAELLRLSLEHYGDLRVFDAAVRALFPAAANPALHRAHPPSNDPAAAIAFLRQVHESLPRARFEHGAWTLEGAA